MGKIQKIQERNRLGWLLAMSLLALLPLNMRAQDIIDDDEEEDVEEVVNSDDEITITDEAGNEEVIDFPEAMTYDLDSLLNLYMSKTYLSIDDDCNMKDTNRTYPKEVYIERLSRLPTVMEMPYNDVVQKFIDRYSGRLRHSVSYMLGACNFYMPIFEEALDAYGLPLELKYLPIIESALNPKAVSRVGATGLWQFMLATGKQYGLNVTSLVDDRRDPIKASYAAARYLKALYKVFGDWNLVIAAYNCGPENVNKAIHRATAAAGHTQEGAPAVKDYWLIYPYLPRETRGYVPAFIAANYIMTYYSDHNICPMSTRLPVKTDTVVVSRNVHLAQIAGVLGLDLDMLRSLNPQYRRDIVPGNTEPSVIKLPVAETVRFIDSADSIYAYNAAELLSKRAEVAVPDDLPTFSSKRKTTVRRKGRTTVRKRTTTARKRTTTARRRTTTARKRTTTARKRTSTARRRR